jgi:putative ABC transport system permease protein
MKPSVWRRLAARVALRGVPPARRPELLADLDEDADARRHRVGRLRLSGWWLREVWSLGRAYRQNARARHLTGRRLGSDLLAQDFRHAVRSLRATPAFTATILLVLTLGIGASTAIFSVVDAVALRPLSFDRSDRLVAVAETNTKSGRVGAPQMQEFFDWHDRQDVFTGLAAIAPYQGVTMVGGTRRAPEIHQVQAITADFFPVLQVTPILGRMFTAGDETDATSNVAIISFGLWQRVFGGRPDVVGQVLDTQLRRFTVVGVLPRDFASPVVATDRIDIWLPFVASPEDRIRAHEYSDYYWVIGRLRDGVSIGRAQSRMEQITAGLAAVYPAWFKDRGVIVEPLVTYLAGDARAWMLLLLGAVACVLAIAYVNVANLLIVRSTTRTRELNIRSALGASRVDLARAILVETLLLSVVGTALGVCAAWWGVDILRASLPADVPRASTIGIDLRALIAASAIAVCGGLATALAPLVGATRRAATGSLRDSSRTMTPGAGQRWVNAALVVVEVALAAFLLVGAGLFLDSYARVTHVNLGLEYHNVLYVPLRPFNDAKMPAEARAAIVAQNKAAFFDILTQVHTLPGVKAAGFVSYSPPISDGLYTADLAIPGQTLPLDADIELSAISADYLQTIRAPLIRGRAFTDTDREGSEPVALINLAAAERYFPAGEPVGRIITLDKINRRIVGVVGNIRSGGPERRQLEAAFVPMTQVVTWGTTLVVRTEGSPYALAAPIDQLIWSRFPDLAMPPARTLEDNLAALIAPRRVNMQLLSLFGILGILVAAVGVYGVMAYVVAQQTREIGIRMALGATSETVLWAVLRRAVTFLGIGIVTGLTAGVMLAAVVQRFLFEVSSRDPRIYVAAGAVLAAAGLGAAIFPARRAARVDPLITLKAE